jgi:hypothetical protein
MSNRDDVPRAIDQRACQKTAIVVDKMGEGSSDDLLEKPGGGKRTCGGVSCEAPGEKACLIPARPQCQNHLVSKSVAVVVNNKRKSRRIAWHTRTT